MRISRKVGVPECAAPKALRHQFATSLREGFRLLSVDHHRHQAKCAVITEADRSATTILLPDDY